MRKTLVISTFVAIALISCNPRPNPAPAPSISATPTPTATENPETKRLREEAIAALQQLQAAVEVGTNMVNYGRAIPPAKVAVDRYANVDKAGSLEMQQAIAAHIIALAWWRCDAVPVEQSADCRDRIVPKIKALDSGLKQIIDGAIAGRTEQAKVHVSYVFDKEKILQLLWEFAGEAIGKAADPTP